MDGLALPAKRNDESAPSIEYWFPWGKTSAFFSSGGVAGWINSSGGTDPNPGIDALDFTLGGGLKL
jgi:hypothetical protein